MARGLRYACKVESDDVWAILRANIKTLFAAAKAKGRPGPRSKPELASESGVGQSTIYRLLDPKERENVRLDNLVAIAVALDVPAWALLMPGLDPAKEQVTMSREALAKLIEARAQELFAGAMDEHARRTRLGVSDPGVDLEAAQELKGRSASAKAGGRPGARRGKE